MVISRFLLRSWQAQEISSSASAFAARLRDGSVVTWGDPAFGGKRVCSGCMTVGGGGIGLWGGGGGVIVAQAVA